MARNLSAVAPRHAPALRHSPRRESGPPRQDLVFAALDGRDLVVSGSEWHVEVYGICEQAGRRWIQLALDGPRHHMVTLALAADLGVRQVVRVLSDWLADPSESDQLLTVP
jgi:hypothetical protein